MTSVRTAVETISAARRLAEAHEKALPDRREGRAYSFGFEDGLHAKPEDPEPDTSDWDDPEWCPASYREGYAFGSWVCRRARAEHGAVTLDEALPRPETPRWIDCHRPANTQDPPADPRYRDPRTEHCTTHSRVLLDLPKSSNRGIYYRWWEGCIGCSAIRPVDEFPNGVVKWRAWRWPEDSPARRKEVA